PASAPSTTARFQLVREPTGGRSGGGRFSGGRAGGGTLAWVGRGGGSWSVGRACETVVDCETGAFETGGIAIGGLTWGVSAWGTAAGLAGFNSGGCDGRTGSPCFRRVP